MPSIIGWTDLFDLIIIIFIEPNILTNVLLSYKTNHKMFKNLRRVPLDFYYTLKGK